MLIIWILPGAAHISRTISLGEGLRIKGGIIETNSYLTNNPASAAFCILSWIILKWDYYLFKESLLHPIYHISYF